MKAIVQDVYGSADVLEMRDIDRPSPGDGEVLVRVHAVGVGPDVWHLMTGLPYPARLVFGLRRPRNPVPGWDAAGRVEAVGANVTDFKPGDEIYGQCSGSMAEYALAKAKRIAPKPGNLTFEQAAAVPVSGTTALQALHTKARLRPGQGVLVIGASGGVGSFAVQLATAHGAEVTGVCGPTAADFVRSLGATDVIDYTREEITDRAHRYDVVVDAAGNRPLSLIRRVLAPKGTFVHVGGEGGSQWSSGIGRHLKLALLSSFLGQNFRGLLAIIRREDLLTLKERLEKGEIVPAVDSTYPLAQAPAAVRHLAKGHPRGKVVVTVP
ncbi:NAD(P)-dependent alcohol dehydrogenase [Streptomyces cavernae]|uniref:NAD(P)-dependent alcohol dehydrogenase n=1 Tax=Streptomyces cavernae TaxID=2259034 RepID=UPI000FEBD068|nr:NAD(P)-dependent alcohol dehydrogenase [Streptomyces cavernae]